MGAESSCGCLHNNGKGETLWVDSNATLLGVVLWITCLLKLSELCKTCAFYNWIEIDVLNFSVLSVCFSGIHNILDNFHFPWF